MWRYIAAAALLAATRAEIDAGNISAAKTRGPADGHNQAQQFRQEARPESRTATLGNATLMNTATLGNATLMNTTVGLKTKNVSQFHLRGPGKSDPKTVEQVKTATPVSEVKAPKEVEVDQLTLKDSRRRRSRRRRDGPTPSCRSSMDDCTEEVGVRNFVSNPDTQRFKENHVADTVEDALEVSKRRMLSPAFTANTVAVKHPTTNTHQDVDLFKAMYQKGVRNVKKTWEKYGRRPTDTKGTYDLYVWADGEGPDGPAMKGDVQKILHYSKVDLGEGSYGIHVTSLKSMKVKFEWTAEENKDPVVKAITHVYAPLDVTPPELR